MSIKDTKDFCFSAQGPCKTMLLSTVGISRCGEIFVTNNADKWTFVCSHCQKATNDIGVFICHIRLDHLNGAQENKEDINTTEMPTIPVSNFFPKEDAQKVNNNLIKEKTNSSLSDSNEMECVISRENSISSLDVSQEMPEDTFTIPPKQQDIEQQDFKSEQLKKEIADDNEKYTTNTVDNDKDINNLNENFDCSPNETIDDKSTIKTKATASVSKRKIQYLGHTCEYCNIKLKYRSILDYHIKKVHNIKPSQMPLKCKRCKKVFRSVSGLNYHLKAHDEKNHQQCPICLVKHKPNYFITHVLTHENDTCFPCQVCGKIHTSKDKRMQHWKSHAGDMPFYCGFCYRRFRKQQYLTHHLKSHFQYQCQFCPTQINAVEYQKPPYICTRCEHLPDIKRRVQVQKLLTNNSNEYESDEVPLHLTNTEDQQLTQNDNESSRDNITIEREFIDSTSLSNSLNNDDNEINESDMEFEYTDDFHNGINASANKTAIIEADNSLHECSYCQKAFKTNKGVTHHIAKVHDKNYHIRFPFKCHHCSKGFQSRSGLCFHRKTHDKSKEFKCPVCAYTDFRENYFITHVMTHEHDSCFPCQVCAKVFPNNDERERHYKIHIKERPHGCNFCNRRFFQRHVLTNHLKIHGQYKCHSCSNNFNSKLIPRQPYTCLPCENKPVLTIVKRKI